MYLERANISIGTLVACQEHGHIFRRCIAELLLQDDPLFSASSDHQYIGDKFEITITEIVFGLLAASVMLTSVRTVPREQGVVEFVSLARTLFVDWAVPFEVASLVLLVALIGAVVMVRAGGEGE